MDERFDLFMQACAGLRSQTTNCENSKVRFREAQSVTDAVLAFREFWVSVVQQVPSKFMELAVRLYADYREEVNAAGVFVNEEPNDYSNPLVFVGGTEELVQILCGRPRVFVLGKAHVVIGDRVRCSCLHQDAVIDSYDYAIVRMERGLVNAYGYSRAEGYGIIHSHDYATIWIEGGDVFDHGHARITARGNSVVHSFTQKKIELRDNAKLVING